MSSSSSSIKSTASSSLVISDLFSVQNKNILVTGGGRGIGLMITEAFVRNGAHVYISSRDEKTITAVAGALTAAGPGTCVAFPADLSSLAGVGVVAGMLAERFGVTKLHCLVNNSGASWGEPLESFSEKGWDKVMGPQCEVYLFSYTRSHPTPHRCRHTHPPRLRHQHRLHRRPPPPVGQHLELRRVESRTPPPHTQVCRPARTQPHHCQCNGAGLRAQSYE